MLRMLQLSLCIFCGLILQVLTLQTSQYPGSQQHTENSIYFEGSRIEHINKYDTGNNNYYYIITLQSFTEGDTTFIKLTKSGTKTTFESNISHNGIISPQWTLMYSIDTAYPTIIAWRFNKYIQIDAQNPLFDMLKNKILRNITTVEQSYCLFFSSQGQKNACQEMDQGNKRKKGN